MTTIVQRVPLDGESLACATCHGDVYPGGHYVHRPYHRDPVIGVELAFVECVVCALTRLGIECREERVELVRSK